MDLLAGTTRINTSSTAHAFLDRIDNPGPAGHQTRPRLASSSGGTIARLVAHRPHHPTREEIELIPVPVCIYDTSGVILAYNRRAADLWGRNPAPGDPKERYCGFSRMLRPDGSAVSRENAAVALALAQERRIDDLEVTIERPDRQRRTVLVTVELLRDAEDRVAGAIECFRDISDWKLASDALHQTAMIETLRRFAADLAHDANNLLAATVSNLNLARKRSGDPEVIRFVEAALRCVKSGQDLAERLTAFAREPDSSGRFGPALWTSLDDPMLKLDREEPLHRQVALLVEDEPGLRTVAADALASLGFDVLDADGEGAAMAIVQGPQAIDLVVVDIGLAPVGATEFLARVRRRRPGLKAIMMTGPVDLAEDLGPFSADTAVLRKPFAIDELAASLYLLLARPASPRGRASPGGPEGFPGPSSGIAQDGDGGQAG